MAVKLPLNETSQLREPRARRPACPINVSAAEDKRAGRFARVRVYSGELLYRPFAVVITSGCER